MNEGKISCFKITTAHETFVLLYYDAFQFCFKQKVYWPLDEYTRTASNSQDEETLELNRLKNLILNNIETHFNLFDISNQSESRTNKDEFSSNLKLARSLPIKKSPFVISLKQPHNLFSAQNIEASLFESGSLYLAMCSYRNQLVQFLIRISLTSNCLLATSVDYEHVEQNKEANLINLDESKAFKLYTCFSKLFNKEFIFNGGDEQKDFSDSLSYLLHTNLIKSSTADQDGHRKFELVKFNMRTFVFFSRFFLYIVQNYAEIYMILEGMMSPLVFSDEKMFTKSIQNIIFEKMLKSLGENKRYNSSGATHLFDFEALSLNLISNAVLSLRQFDILTKCQTNNFEINLNKLKCLNESLKYAIRTNRFKLRRLSEIVKLFEKENKLDLKTDGDVEKFDFDCINYSSNVNNLNELSNHHYECFSPNRISKLSKL